MAPKTDPKVHISANLIALLGAPIAIAISSTSGGIGKKVASVNATKKSA
tara:strand:+ start:185 stop:331 length:147 start_codon:yes stop_codon:yes gene_type:complete